MYVTRRTITIKCKGHIHNPTGKVPFLHLSGKEKKKVGFICGKFFIAFIIIIITDVN